MWHKNTRSYAIAGNCANKAAMTPPGAASLRSLSRMQQRVRVRPAYDHTIDWRGRRSCLLGGAGPRTRSSAKSMFTFWLRARSAHPQQHTENVKSLTGGAHSRTRSSEKRMLRV